MVAKDLWHWEVTITKPFKGDIEIRLCFPKEVPVWRYSKKDGKAIIRDLDWILGLLYMSARKRKGWGESAVHNLCKIENPPERQNSPSVMLHKCTNTSLKMAHAINQKHSGRPLDGIRWCIGLCCYPGGNVKSWKPEYLRCFFIFFIVNIYFTLCITTSKNHKWGIAVPNIQHLESLI